jgi:hypothetical protein
MASKMLYSTRNPEMLRALVGEDITKEFVAFCNQEVITLNDVINENYNYRDIEVLNTAKSKNILSRVLEVNIPEEVYQEIENIIKNH